MAQTSSGKMILITGATGKQGGAALRHLIGSEFKLRALTRDAGSDAARQITAAGVEVARGDRSDAREGAKHQLRHVARGGSRRVYESYRGKTR